MSKEISKDDILGLAEELSKVTTTNHPDSMTISACVNVMRDLAEIHRNAEDAQRYRFLRDKQATIIYKRVGFGEWEPLIDTFETSTRSASLDAAIDAAMQANAEVNG